MSFLKLRTKDKSHKEIIEKQLAQDDEWLRMALARLGHLETICKKKGVTNGATIGMIYKEMLKDDLRRLR